MGIMPAATNNGQRPRGRSPLTLFLICYLLFGSCSLQGRRGQAAKDKNLRLSVFALRAHGGGGGRNAQRETPPQRKRESPPLPSLVSCHLPLVGGAADAAIRYPVPPAPRCCPQDSVAVSSYTATVVRYELPVELRYGEAARAPWQARGRVDHRVGHESVSCAVHGSSISSCA
jgi:hypothetical protein